ncbi:hypothetical protein M9Y10_034550 [Tritrichomonas musculus]|uniref:Uncharacterized protein n=1 Tax=Tritrichomonas musculus TaxID=1915356 RepID=A0ABR2KFA3_9EUKA
MTLEEKRHQLTVDTLKEVVDNLKQVMNLRNPDCKLELYFNAATVQMNYQLKMSTSASSVTTGSLMTNENSTVFHQCQYSLFPFPFIFLHQVAYQSALLSKEVTYILNHPDMVDLPVVDKFLESANSISCIFSDPKFTEIDLKQYFAEPIQDHLAIHLIYKDSIFYVKFSGIVGASDILAPNFNDSTLVKDIEKKIHHVIKALKYLRSDVCRWAIQE